MSYFDQEANEHYIPYVIEPSLGADRVTLAFLVDAYDEEVVDAEKNDVRTVLRLHPALAPYKCAVLPLSKKLGEKGREIQQMLSKYFMVDYDDAGSIGKRYRRQDEIGTPDVYKRQRSSIVQATRRTFQFFSSVTRTATSTARVASTPAVTVSWVR